MHPCIESPVCCRYQTQRKGWRCAGHVGSWSRISSWVRQWPLSSDSSLNVCLTTQLPRKAVSPRPTPCAWPLRPCINSEIGPYWALRLPQTGAQLLDVTSSLPMPACADFWGPPPYCHHAELATLEPSLSTPPHPSCTLTRGLHNWSATH